MSIENDENDEVTEVLPPSRLPAGGGLGARKSPVAAGGKRRRKKVCPFCKDASPVIDYKAADRLKRYLSDRGKIVPRRIAGTCAKHHRELSIVIRRARTMALLPYVGSGERDRVERSERGERVGPDREPRPSPRDRE